MTPKTRVETDLQNSCFSELNIGHLRCK